MKFLPTILSRLVQRLNQPFAISTSPSESSHRDRQLSRIFFIEKRESEIFEKKAQNNLWSIHWGIHKKISTRSDKIWWSFPWHNGKPKFEKNPISPWKFFSWNMGLIDFGALFTVKISTRSASPSWRSRNDLKQRVLLIGEYFDNSFTDWCPFVP